MSSPILYQFCSQALDHYASHKQAHALSVGSATMHYENEELALPDWAEEVCRNDPKFLAVVKQVRAEFDEKCKNREHPGPSFLHTLD